MFKNLNEMQKKLIKITLIGIGILALLFLTIWLMNLAKGGKLSYEKIEDKMVKAAQSYYEKNKDLLPADTHAKVEIDVDTLVKEGYMKSLNEYTDKNVSCTGKVIALKNDSHYTFIPNLDCEGDYVSNNLVKKLTSPSNIVTISDGLYEINGEYVYRGENLNNYVSFAGKIWRVLKITKDGEIRLIQDDSFKAVDWDNRYNEQRKDRSGINEFENNGKYSRIKNDLDEIYNGELFSSEDKAKIVPKKLCIGKRNYKEQSIDGNVECSVLTEDYYSLGLLQANEFFIPSLDESCNGVNKRQCTNYNFLATYDDSFWTITASNENSYEVFYVDYVPQTGQAKKQNAIKLVINLSGEVNYTEGNGTLENPYIVD